MQLSLTLPCPPGADDIPKVRQRVKGVARKAPVVKHLERITFTQLIDFLNSCLDR